MKYERRSFEIIITRINELIFLHRMVKPFLLIVLLMVGYYSIYWFVEPIRFANANPGSVLTTSDLILDIILDAGLNIVLAFLFGLIFFGLLGIPSAKLFFLIQKFKSRKIDVRQKFAMLKTSGKTTGSGIVYRGFLLYCVAISLTLSTLQFIGHFAPTIIEDSFTILYTSLVLFYMAFLTFFLPSIWYLDDINLMYFTMSEDVKFLNPMGQSILPALKGFGSFSIIIAYLIYVMNRFSILDLDILFDPILTLFIPLLAMLGFETIAEFGQKIVKKWIGSKDIRKYDELKIELVMKGDEVKISIENEEAKWGGTDGTGQTSQ
jgi:hypothetical protein